MILFNYFGYIKIMFFWHSARTAERVFAFILRKLRAAHGADKSVKFHRREFNYTRFEQALLLPENVDNEAITARACSGILHIELPKLTALPNKQPARVIEIQ